MSKTFLKIKIMSLAAEAKIIRTEANKVWENKKTGQTGFIHDKETRFELHCHRRFDVRSEARSAQLAYGFLRNRPYRSMEQKCHTVPNAARITEIAVKFGRLDKKQTAASVMAWLTTLSVQQAHGMVGSKEPIRQAAS